MAKPVMNSMDKQAIREGFKYVVIRGGERRAYTTTASEAKQEAGKSGKVVALDKMRYTERNPLPNPGILWSAGDHGHTAKVDGTRVGFVAPLVNGRFRWWATRDGSKMISGTAPSLGLSKAAVSRALRIPKGPQQRNPGPSMQWVPARNPGGKRQRARGVRHAEDRDLGGATTPGADWSGALSRASESRRKLARFGKDQRIYTADLPETHAKALTAAKHFRHRAPKLPNPLPNPALKWYKSGQGYNLHDGDKGGGVLGGVYPTNAGWAWVVWSEGGPSVFGQGAEKTEAAAKTKVERVVILQYSNILELRKGTPVIEWGASSAHREGVAMGPPKAGKVKVRWADGKVSSVHQHSLAV